MASNPADEWYAMMQYALLASDRKRARRALHLREFKLIHGREAAKVPGSAPLRRLDRALIGLGKRPAPRDMVTSKV